MKKIFKKFKVILVVGLTTALLSTSASASSASGNHGFDYLNTGNDYGAYMYDVETGETTYIPPEQTETYSDETEGFSPGYNPYADEDNNGEGLIEPYYTDHGRMLVNDPANHEMFRNTVYIECTYKDFNGITRISTGTGFMIGPNAVATAAHMIYKIESQGSYFVGNATIYPAHNSSSNPNPFGVAHAKRFYCGSGWAYSGDLSDDWGIIELDTNIGNKTGWLGLRWQSADYKNKSVFVNGYPGTVNGKENTYRNQYYRHGTVSSSNETNTLKSTDIFISKGDSGGPCYIYSNDTGYTAIGITSRFPSNDDNGTDIDCAKFRTIDKSLYERLVQYRTSTL